MNDEYLPELMIFEDLTVAKNSNLNGEKFESLEYFNLSTDSNNILGLENDYLQSKPYVVRLRLKLIFDNVNMWYIDEIWTMDSVGVPFEELNCVKNIKNNITDEELIRIILNPRLDIALVDRLEEAINLTEMPITIIKDLITQKHELLNILAGVI